MEPQQSQRVLVVGHLAWITAAVVDAVPAPDRDVIVRSLESHPGGAGGNVAATLSALGMSTLLLTHVGRDRLGWLLRRDLARHGVDVSLIGRSARPTTEFIVVGDTLGQRSFYIDPNTATFDRVSGLKNVPWADLVGVCVVDPDLENAAEVVSQAKRAGARVAINVGLAAAAGKLNSGWIPVVHDCEAAFLNRSELTGLPDSVRRQLMSDQTGADLLVVTNGSKPATVYRRGRLQEAPRALRPPAVAFPLGCGDAFMAGYVHALWSGLPILAAASAHLTASIVAGRPQERSPQFDFGPVKSLIATARCRGNDS